MNTPTSSPSAQQPKPVLLDDIDLDCPHPQCGGWLMAYGDAESKKPSYLKCSNDFEKDGIKVCLQKTIFSKYRGICTYCNKPIRLKEIITSDDKVLAPVGASPRKWVHSKCFRSKPRMFAFCQRCRKIIETESAAEESICSGISGYKHVKCPNKRKIFDEEADDFGGCSSNGSSSQQQDEEIV